MTRGEAKGSQSSPLYLRDDPIIDEEDIEFTHGQYIDSLEEIITESSPPWNVGLFGHWGNGKSSVIRILQQRINQRDDGRRFLTFDAWKHAEGSIRTQLLLDINRKLGTLEADTDDGSRSLRSPLTSKGSSEDIDQNTPIREEDIIARLYDSKQRLRSPNTSIKSQIQDFISAHPLGLLTIFGSTVLIALWQRGVITLETTGLLILAQLVASVIVGLDQSTQTLEQRIDNPRKEWSGAYEHIFEEMIEKGSEDEVVIAIDNLDRCDSQTVYEVLVSLKTFMENDKCKYILVCDDDALRNHIDAIDEGEYFADYATSQEFIRKFFQAYLRLPPIIDANIEAYARNQNQKLKHPHLERTIEVLLEAKILTPRRVKHLINRLTTQRRVGRRLENSKDVVEGRFTSEDGQALLMKMIVLQEEFPTFYQAVRDKPRILQLAHDTALSPDSSLDETTEISGIFKLEEMQSPDRINRLESFLEATADVHADQLPPYIFFNQPEYAVELGGTEALESALKAPESSPEEVAHKIQRILAEGDENVEERCSEAIIEQIRTLHRRDALTTLSVIVANLVAASRELSDEDDSFKKSVAEKLYHFKNETYHDPFSEAKEDDLFYLFRYLENSIFWSNWMEELLDNFEIPQSEVDDIRPVIVNWKRIPEEVKNTFLDNIDSAVKPYYQDDPNLEYFDWLLDYISLINDYNESQLSQDLISTGSSYLGYVDPNHRRSFTSLVGKYYSSNPPKAIVNQILDGLTDGFPIESDQELQSIKAAFTHLGVGYEHHDLESAIEIIEQLPFDETSILIVEHVLRRDTHRPDDMNREMYESVDLFLERFVKDGSEDAVTAVISPLPNLEYRLTQFEGVKKGLISRYPDASLDADELNEVIIQDDMTKDLVSAQIHELLNSDSKVERVSGARLYDAWSQSPEIQLEIDALQSLLSDITGTENIPDSSVLSILIDYFEQFDSENQRTIVDSVLRLARKSSNDRVVLLWKRLVPKISSGRRDWVGNQISQSISEELQSEKDTQVLYNLLMIFQQTHEYVGHTKTTKTLSDVAGYLSSETAGQHDFELLLPIIRDIVTEVDSIPSSVADFLDKIKSGSLCPSCGSEKIVSSSNQTEVYCENCGLVIEEEQIDPGPEWRAFNHQERQEKSRVGAPTTQTMHDKGLTTTIDWKDKDAYGRSISSKKRSQMHRLRKWQERIRTKDAGERNLQFALSEIDRMASALGVPRSVREVASVIYRRALSEDLIRGRSIEGVATAALYAACRKEGIPRSLEEISEVSRVKRKEIGRSYRYISQELGLEMEPVDPKKYVPRLCSELNLSEEVQAKANEIIETTAEEGLLAKKSPTGYAAGAIYTASHLCDENITQREVAEAAQVTEVTIRNRYQEQIEAMGIHG